MPEFSALASISLIVNILLIIILVFFCFKLFKIKQEDSNKLATIDKLEFFTKHIDRHQHNLYTKIDNDLARLQNSLNTSLTHKSNETASHINLLRDRLMLIDRTQQEMVKLSGEIVSFQKLFSNNQVRGLYGQKQMEQIIREALPDNAYSFQNLLSNKLRPDCLIHMPNQAPPLVIDAKFPLEYWSAYNNSQNDQEKELAAKKFSKTMEQHIEDIARKYLIRGETQDIAFLFVPSDSIFVSLYQEFDMTVQKAFRKGIVIVSPCLLLLAISVVKYLWRDQHMRQEAKAIQKMIQEMLQDVQRLDSRVVNLGRHFRQANEDIDQINISNNKIKERGQKITNIQLEDAPLDHIMPSKPNIAPIA